MQYVPWRSMGRWMVLLASLALSVVVVPATQAATLVTNCSEAGLRAAIAIGGEVTFNCGTPQAIISIASEIEVRGNLVIDGGGKVTLKGGGGRIFFHRSYGTQTSSLTLRRLTISGGRAIGYGEAANGGAIKSVNNSIDGKTYPQTLIIDQVVFSDNDTNTTGYDGGKGLNAYDFGGGAIFSQGGYLTISASSFSDNDAANGAGGAIHILQSSATISGSSFNANSAIGKTPADSLGGAIYVDGMKDDAGQLQITASRFSNNRSYNSGGAIHVNAYTSNNRLFVDQSSFINNKIDGGERAQGGAIGGGGTGNSLRIEISRSLFQGNSVKKSAAPFDGSGGALAFPQPARLTITNSTFYQNRAEGTSYNANGGALYVVNNPQPFEVSSSSFAENTAGWVGGAITGNDGRLVNSLFRNNSAANGGNDWKIRQTCSDTLQNGGSNLQFPGFTANQFNLFNDRVCVENIRVADAQSAAPADNGGPTATMAITTSSPAFDQGANCPASDQRGISRPQGAACDIGAFELLLALSVSPALISADQGDLTLEVRGAGFSNGNTVRWGAQSLATTYVDSTLLRAVLPQAQIGAPRSVAVTVSGSSLPAAQVQVVAALIQAYLPLTQR